MVKEKFLEICTKKWKTDMAAMPKLKTYIKLQDDIS